METGTSGLGRNQLPWAASVMILEEVEEAGRGGAAAALLVQVTHKSGLPEIGMALFRKILPYVS